MILKFVSGDARARYLQRVAINAPTLKDKLRASLANETVATLSGDSLEDERILTDLLQSDGRAYEDIKFSAFSG